MNDSFISSTLAKPLAIRNPSMKTMKYKKHKSFIIGAIILATVSLLFNEKGLSLVQNQDSEPEQDTCNFSAIPGAVFWTTERKLTIRQLACYCAPVYWFSPDEPTLNNKQGKNIGIPSALPFEFSPGIPVVYYQYNRILVREDADNPGYYPDEIDKNNSVIDLHNVSGIEIKFIAYFEEDFGLGRHLHDVEPTTFKIFIARSDEEFAQAYSDIHCDNLHYIVRVSKVTGGAHGLEWFYNVLVVDEYTSFPMHLLVEEGKHAMCPDKNNDGYYTPGFDVNRRVNDAWGVRDIIHQGALFTGAYQAWMTKVRKKEHRVFPPLPENSPLREKFLTDGVYASDNTVYQLRPFPSSELAGDDALLKKFMADKEKPNWPVIEENTDLKRLEEWVTEGLAIKSFALSFRTDGDIGWALVFPFFIVRNFETPLTHGFLVHRIYFKDKKLRDFGWMIMYTHSASRWIDSYFAAGAEWNKMDIVGENRTALKTDFVFEMGIKFRVNITESPLKFLGFFTPFWGFRAGIKNRGFFNIGQLNYVLELGAGVW